MDSLNAQHSNLEYEWTPDYCIKTSKLDSGSMTQWYPKSKDELNRVLDELDSQQNSRAPYRVLGTLIDASPFFIADTGPLATMRRKVTVGHLIPTKFAKIAWAYTQNHTISNSSIGDFALQVIGQGLLGIDESTIEAHLKDLQNLGKDFKKYSILPIPSDELKSYLEFQKLQHRYQTMIETLLKTEIQKVHARLSTESRSCLDEGLLTKEIARLIEQNPDNLQNLHENKDLKSLVLLLVATDNLEQSIDSAFELLYRSPIAHYTSDNDKRSLLEDLRDEIRSSGVLQENKQGVHLSILRDPNQMPFLDACYRTCLRDLFSNRPILIRYVENGITCDGYKIPPNTYLMIHSTTDKTSNLSKPFTEQPLLSSVFSAGNRSCPAQLVATTIFKTVLVAIASEFM